MKLLRKMKKGFTLVELVVVIAVIAILSGVSVVTYVSVTNRAKQSTCDSEASTFKRLVLAEDINENGFAVTGNSIKFESSYTLAKLVEALKEPLYTTGENGSVREEEGKIVYHSSNGMHTEVFTIAE